jgi:hypothetical protein
MFRSVCHSVVGLLALAAAWNAAPTKAQAQFFPGAYYSRPVYPFGFAPSGSGSFLYYSNGRMTTASGYMTGRGGYGSFSYYRNRRSNRAVAIGSFYGRGCPYRRGFRR